MIDSDTICRSVTRMARELGQCDNTIIRWCAHQGMPHYRTGKHGGIYLFNRQEVAEWLSKRPWMRGARPKQRKGPVASCGWGMSVRP